MPSACHSSGREEPSAALFAQASEATGLAETLVHGVRVWA